VGAPGPSSRPTADEAGFRDWASLRLPSLRRKAYLLTGDWHRADDLVQDTLVGMYAVWPRVARGENVDGYASRVLVHKHVDEKRRPWRREHLVDAVPETVDDAAALGFDAVDARDDVLVAALAALPAVQRAVLVLRYTDDLALDDIARLLDLPVGTVKSRLSRGSDAVRAELARLGHPRAGAAVPSVSSVSSVPEGTS
jgi:RNA polymerase sigma-70 factor (sigma-E family)